MKISELLEARAMPVVYYDRFIERLAEINKRDRKTAERIAAKIDEFLDAKTANPLQRFGTSDSAFSTSMSGYRHFHVSRNPDVVVIYSMEGKKIRLIDIVDHDIISKSSASAKHARKLDNARPVREE